MNSQPVRFSQIRALISIVAILWMIGGAAVLIIGVLRAQNGLDQGLWQMVAGGALIVSALFMTVQMMLLLKVEDHNCRQHDALRDVLDALERQRAHIESIAENTRISDAAKSVAHRDQELAALRQALHEDIQRNDWEAATRLVDEIERRFGYRQEAESLREEIQIARAEAMRRKLDEAAARVGQLIAAGDWLKARREIDRLERVLPDEPRVAEIEAEFAQRREQRKRELLKNWSEAVRRDDIDEGIQILKELDQHLTREEAQSLEASARELFKEKLQQLGVQFRFAVKEKRWRDALEIGVQLIEEFPNTRMASEVAEHIDGLRKRAGVTSDVEVVARETPAVTG